MKNFFIISLVLLTATNGLYSAEKKSIFNRRASHYLSPESRAKLATIRGDSKVLKNSASVPQATVGTVLVMALSAIVGFKDLEKKVVSTNQKPVFKKVKHNFSNQSNTTKKPYGSNENVRRTGSGKNMRHEQRKSISKKSS